MVVGRCRLQEASSLTDRYAFQTRVYSPLLSFQCKCLNLIRLYRLETAKGSTPSENVSPTATLHTPQVTQPDNFSS